VSLGKNICAAGEQKQKENRRAAMDDASACVSKKWPSHFFEFCKSSQPEVVWICKELILLRKINNPAGS